MHPPKVLTFVLVLAIVSCSRSGPPPLASAPAGAAGSPAAAAAGLPLASRAMRITVDMFIEVADLDAAALAIRKAAAAQGGYVSEARTSGEAGQVRTASFEAKIPVSALAAFRAELSRLGQVASESEKAEDVTEQRADIDARVRNAHAQEQRLLALLGNRTGTLADVMAVERELAAVRESIERLEAQQRVLEGQIAYATVTVRLATRWHAAPIGAWGRIAGAGAEGIHAAGELLVNLAVGALSGGPSFLILAVVGYACFLVVRFVARRRRKSAGAAPATPGGGQERA